MTRDRNPITQLVSTLSRRTRMYFARQLTPYGLSFGHFRILRFLRDHAGVRQEDLRAYVDIDKGAAAHAMKRLVDLGLVVRAPHPEDGRAYLIRLTQKAHEFLHEFDRVAAVWDERLVSGLSPEEARQAEELLQRLVDNASAPIQDRQGEHGECRRRHHAQRH
ncbi:MAG: MarR family transcriptional regulator [Coriobacteriia bacterium]|nr:MarR family transcriptional regulator [Coriobacteriia bacterium]